MINLMGIERIQKITVRKRAQITVGISLTENNFSAVFSGYFSASPFTLRPNGVVNNQTKGLIYVLTYKDLADKSTTVVSKIGAGVSGQCQK